MDRSNATHPLVIAAAVAVLASSALAAAIMTGVLPSATSKTAEGSTLALLAAPAPASHAGGAQATRPGKVAKGAACASCGVIESIRAEEVKGEASGVGAVAGGVTGAVVGNQFGNGAGRTAMTVLGAAGGAYAGNAIEKNVKTRTVYRVTLRMDDGSQRTLSQAALPAQGVGERVRLVDGSRLERV